jgi:hypothetical protein
MAMRVLSRGRVAPAGALTAAGTLCLALVLAAVGCGDQGSEQQANAPSVAPVAPAPPPTQPQVPLGQPVPFWEHGKLVRLIDGATAEREYLLLDLSEAWTPYLFADGTRADGSPVSSAYKGVYQALARGDFGEDLHGQRAQEDKYLELYGILPTLSLVRARMQATAKLPCAAALDLAPLVAFSGVETYTSHELSRKAAKDFASWSARVNQLLQQQQVATPEELDRASLSRRDQLAVARYIERLPARAAIEAMQQRLKCEGYLAGKGKILSGVIDWATHEALAEFERRHRVFSWGFIGKDSLVYLRMKPIEADREALLRVLTERAVEIAGVLEDGSTSTYGGSASPQPRLYRGADGKDHQVPNLVSALRGILIDAFGLQTPESTLAWLESLGDLPRTGQRLVAIKMPPLPEYYGPDMQLTFDYDRGDVWYDFPFDDQGRELPQPVQRRPNMTVSVQHNGAKIPLARFGTTIGGWRSEAINGVSMYKYKESPVGARAFEEIVAAPVWLPPDSTPPEELLVRNARRKLTSEPEYLVNYHETGPSYASAYGLVAAYHRDFWKRPDGVVILGRDEGIRTHGSVDYMSIMRRHSHGCHRLHNHIALRVMSFVLAHRPHERLGQEALGYKKRLAVRDKNYLMDIRQGGYVFKLKSPLFLNVEEGRVRGSVKRAIDFPIPKWNPDYGAYVMPDGSTVQVRGAQLIQLTPPLAVPAADAGTTEWPATSQAPAVSAPPGVAGRRLAASRGSERVEDW